MNETMTARQAAHMLHVDTTAVNSMAKWYAIPYALERGSARAGRRARYDAASVRRVAELRQQRAAHARWLTDAGTAGLWPEPTPCPRCGAPVWLQEMAGGLLRLVEMEAGVEERHDCATVAHVPVRREPLTGRVVFQAVPTAARWHS